MSNLINIQQPQISVIMPVFNRREIIKRALDSLESQTFTNFELLIVDDGSTDALEEIIFPEIQKRSNWRYLKHANRKVALTRNIGINAALGTYITFLDSDDEYLPDHLRLRLEFMKGNKDIDVIHGGVKLVGPEETFWVTDVRDRSKLIHINDCCVGATLFTKKEIFLSVGNFPAVPYSSEFYLLEKLAAEYRIAKVDFPTYVYHTDRSDRICLKRK